MCALITSKHKSDPESLFFPKGDLCSLIRQQLRDLKITQKDLAEQIGHSREYLNRALNGSIEMPKPLKAELEMWLLGCRLKEGREIDGEVQEERQSAYRPLIAPGEPETDVDRAKVACHAVLADALDAAGSDLVRVHWVEETLRQHLPTARWRQDQQQEIR